SSAHPDGLPSGASNPLLKGQNATGQIVRYLNRTYRLLPTRKPARLVLRRKAESYSEFAAVAKQLLKAALVVWRRDDQYIANIGHHKRGQRIIDHRLVVDRQELLRNYKCQRVKPRA